MGPVPYFFPRFQIIYQPGLPETHGQGDQTIVFYGFNRLKILVVDNSDIVDPSGFLGQDQGFHPADYPGSVSLAITDRLCCQL